MVQREITMRVEQEKLIPSTRIAGHEGEHLATLLRFVLPEDWILDNTLSYYVGYYVEGSGKRYRTENQQWPVEVSLPQSVMVEGRLIVQLNAVALNDPQNSIIKSAACTMLVKRSVHGAYDEVDDSMVGLLEGAVSAFEAKLDELDALVGLPEQITALDAAKVDKTEGKSLSSNDYTDEEKEKLAGIAPNANHYTHPATAGNKHIPPGGSSGQILGWLEDGAAAWTDNQGTTYSPATPSADGLMSSTDKAKLDGVEANANNYVHPTTAGNKHIPSGGSSGKVLRWASNGTAVWGDDQDTTYSPATTTSNGLMSSSDKTKLNGIATGANKYTHPATHPASMITGLADVATSGDFADLDNPPVLKGTGIGAVILSSNSYNKSSGTYSASLNGNTNAVGSYSTAAGHQTTANGYQFVCGKYNTALDAFNDQNKNGYLVAVGNGNSRANSNALTLSGAGVLNCSEYATTGGDYSELFEWADQNSNGEDRRGRFVTLDGNKIKIADADDHYILGIVSATPAVTGNNPNQWHQMYLLDVFGQPLTEEVEIPAHTDPDTGEEVPAKTVIREILNPDYDPEQVYIPRSERKEWAAIGMMGQLIVIDDGTCEVNGYCRPANEGIATSDPDGPYRVMGRLDSTHIRVLFPGTERM